MDDEGPQASWTGEPLEVFLMPADDGWSAWWRRAVAVVLDLLVLTLPSAGAGRRYLVGLRGANTYRTYWRLTLDTDEASYYETDLKRRLVALGDAELMRSLSVE